MSAAPMTILAIAAIALFVVALVMAATYSRYHGAWTVECPETDSTVDVKIDVKRAVMTSAIRKPEVRVQECARWPERGDCDQACVHSA